MIHFLLTFSEMASEAAGIHQPPSQPAADPERLVQASAAAAAAAAAAGSSVDIVPTGHTTLLRR